MRIKTFVILILLCSCSKTNKTVYVRNELETGLLKGADVRINGLSIGKVDDILLTEDFQSLIKISFDKEIRIPIGSSFKVKGTDLFNSTIVMEIMPAKSNQYIHYGDTIQLDTTYNPQLYDTSLISKLGYVINGVLNSTKHDSLVEEINSLKSELDSFKKLQKNR